MLLLSSVKNGTNKQIQLHYQKIMHTISKAELRTIWGFFKKISWAVGAGIIIFMIVLVFLSTISQNNEHQTWTINRSRTQNFSGIGVNGSISSFHSSDSSFILHLNSLPYGTLVNPDDERSRSPNVNLYLTIDSKTIEFPSRQDMVMKFNHRQESIYCYI